MIMLTVAKGLLTFIVIAYISVYRSVVFSRMFPPTDFIHVNQLVGGVREPGPSLSAEAVHLDLVATPGCVEIRTGHLNLLLPTHALVTLARVVVELAGVEPGTAVVPAGLPAELRILFLQSGDLGGQLPDDFLLAPLFFSTPPQRSCQG